MTGVESPAAGTLGDVRLAELMASAQALGCARVVCLGYADSGMDGADSGMDGADSGMDGADSGMDGAGNPADGRVPAAGAMEGGPLPFARVDVATAAQRLALELRAEEADLLTIYDPAGGYGHPDHVQVHRVGSLAARLAGTPTVLEATVDRRLLVAATALLAPLARVLPAAGARRMAAGYVAARQITHRVPVRRYARAKRASMAAHVSQRTGGEGTRTLAALLRLPLPLFCWALGTECYVQRGLPSGRPLRHPFAAAGRRGAP